MLLLAADASVTPPLSMELRLPLSALHFLEFAVWGAWFVVLGQYLDNLGFSRKMIGRIYATMPIGSVLAPMLVGTLADKYFDSRLILIVSHLVGAALLYWMAQITTPRKFYWVALAYALVYSPTLSLVNSVVFAHVPDGTRDFPMIRVLGTIGWIAAGLSLKLLLKPGEGVNNRPLLLAAGLSALLGLTCFTLPATPPKGTADLFPFMAAIELLREPSFAVFFGVSFIITIALSFYFGFTSLYLERGVGVRPENVGPLMTIGQWVEVGVFFTLSWFLETLGMKWVLAIGMASWGIRYLFFAAGKPFPLILIALALHGFCFDFFLGAGFIHVDKTAPKAIAASAQSLFGMLTYGLGMYLGTEASGWLNQWLTKKSTGPNGEEITVTDWRTFWAIPAVGVAISLVLFIALFKS